jgi:hypothetical protein
VVLIDGLHELAKFGFGPAHRRRHHVTIGANRVTINLTGCMTIGRNCTTTNIVLEQLDELLQARHEILRVIVEPNRRRLRVTMQDLRLRIARPVGDRTFLQRCAGY